MAETKLYAYKQPSKVTEGWTYCFYRARSVPWHQGTVFVTSKPQLKPETAWQRVGEVLYQVGYWNEGDDTRTYPKE